MNILHIKECLLLSCAASFEDWSCIFRTRSFTLCKNDLDINDMSDSATVLESISSSSSTMNLSVCCADTTGRPVLSSINSSDFHLRRQSLNNIPFWVAWWVTVYNGSPRSIINIWTWHRHWKWINFTLILSFSSLTVAVVGEDDELEEDVERCLSCLAYLKLKDENWRKNSLIKPRTTIGTKFSVLHCVRKPFWMRCGFWPLIHSYEYACSSQSLPSDKTTGVFFDVHCGLFTRLHFNVGCKNRRRTSRCRHGFQSSGIQVLFADQTHRRSGVHNKFCWQAYFPKVRRMLLFLAPLNFIHLWSTSTLLRGHLALAILSLPETDPQILEDWG